MNGVPFLSNNSLGRQPQYVEPAIAYYAVELRCRYSYAGVKKGRVFNGIAIEALGAIFEH